MPSLDFLEAHLGAVATGRESFDPSQAGVGLWLHAIERRFLSIDRKSLLALLSRLNEAFPKTPRLEIYLEIFTADIDLPDKRLPFVDTERADINWVLHPNSDRVIFVCCNGRNFGVPLSMLHIWICQVPAHIVYLRDFSGRRFLTGIKSIGSYDVTIETLKTKMRENGVTRSCTLGISSTAYGALKLGLSLNTNSVALLAGATNLNPEFIVEHNLQNSLNVDSLIPTHFDQLMDLAEEVRQHLKPPRIGTWYSPHIRRDRLQAESLRRCPSAELFPLQGCNEHNVVRWLLKNGQLMDVIRWTTLDSDECGDE